MIEDTNTLQGCRAFAFTQAECAASAQQVLKQWLCALHCAGAAAAYLRTSASAAAAVAVAAACGVHRCVS
jgi:hypothetical protein